MTAKLSDYSARPCKTPNAEKWVLTVDVPIGASGAAGTHDGDAGITLAKNATGVYDVVFPACPKAKLHVTLKSAAKTVVGSVVLAKDAGAGTAQIATLAGTNAAANTEPADGDVITVTVIGQPYTV
jgi:hypothetical protein